THRAHRRRQNSFLSAFCPPSCNRKRSVSRHSRHPLHQHHHTKLRCFREVFAPLSKVLGQDIVLEHHSKFNPSKETETNRLATENWDAPLIVATTAQFFESLLANRTSTCRKLHRIARSVVVFDEAQALPASLLHPILRGL